MNGLVVLLSLLPALPAAPDDSVRVGHGVPSNAAFYLHWKIEDDGLLRRLDKFRSVLAGSGFLETARTRWIEAVEKSSSPAGAESSAPAKRWLEEESIRWRDALEAVPWWRLASREGAVALEGEGESLEALALFRVDRVEREETVRSLRNVLYAFCSASRRFEMVQSIHDGESIDVLYRIPLDDEAAGGERHLAGLVDEILGGGRRERELCLAGKGDFVVISTSANLLSRSLQLLDGAGSDIGFPFTARREEGLARLGSIPPARAGGFEVHARPSELLKNLQLLGAFESFVAAGGSDGDSMAYAYRAELPAAGGGEAAAARKALEGAGISGALRLVPKDATSFRVGAGLLLKVGADLLGGIADALAPEDASDAVKGLIHESSSHLTGPHALSVSEEGLFFALEVDESLAGRFRDSAKKKEREVVEEGGALLFPPKPGSKSLMALAGKVFLGGNAETVRKSLAAIAGKVPSLADDQDRLKAAGAPLGDLLSLTEMNVKTALTVAAGASIAAPLLLRALPEDEEHAIARAFVGALPRLFPVANSLKFLDRFTAHARKDGPAAVRGEGRITFAE